MNLKRDYTKLIEAVATDKGGLYYLNGTQITEKQVGYFLTDSVLCLADNYMKHYNHVDTNMDFVLSRRAGNLSPFPLTAVSRGKDTMFCIVSPFVVHVLEEHVIPYRSELSAVFQLSGGVLDKDFDLRIAHPELVDNVDNDRTLILINSGYKEQDAIHGRSIS